MGTGLDRVELDPQGFLFFPLAVVPRAPLKPHYQNIVPDEVGALTILQQPLVGRIGTKIAQLLRRVDASTGAAFLERGAKIADGRNRVSHTGLFIPQLAACHFQMLA